MTMPTFIHFPIDKYLGSFHFGSLWITVQTLLCESSHRHKRYVSLCLFMYWWDCFSHSFSHVRFCRLKAVAFTPKRYLLWPPNPVPGPFCLVEFPRKWKHSWAQLKSLFLQNVCPSWGRDGKGHCATLAYWAKEPQSVCRCGADLWVLGVLPHSSISQELFDGWARELPKMNFETVRHI